MVGLANELEGQPFHLIASFNQRGDEKKARHELFQNGLSIDSSNVSATLSARHPDVTGITYVPYYLVFDQHGELAYHHQGGPYHGGDGDAVLDRVREMIADLPAVYIGKEAYASHDKLAQRIASGKGLASALEDLASGLSESPDDRELNRLAVAAERHAARSIALFESSVSKDPKAAFKSLKSAAKAYRGTPWGQELLTLESALNDKGLRKRYEQSSKDLGKILKAWDKLEGQRGNGGEVRNPTEPEFRSANQKALSKLTPLLQAMSGDYGDLPAGKRATEVLEWLQS